LNPKQDNDLSGNNLESLKEERESAGNSLVNFTDQTFPLDKSKSRRERNEDEDD